LATKIPLVNHNCYVKYKLFSVMVNTHLWAELYQHVKESTLIGCLILSMKWCQTVN